MVVAENSSAPFVPASASRPARPARPARTIRRDSELREIVAAAAAGDPQAWTALTEQFSSMIMAVARSCRLNDADVGEVHQVTWLRLVENIGRIEQPERIGAWLATTAKRESLRIVRNKSRVTIDHEALLQRPDMHAKSLDAGPIAEEDAELVRRAVALLPAHCQRLLSLMAQETPLSYKEISKRLGMPIGSIGPTRGRCLEHLRRIIDELSVGVA